MNEHDLLDAVGDIDEKYINNAAKSPKKKKRNWNGWVAVAAGLAAAVAITVGIVVSRMNPASDGDGVDASLFAKSTETSKENPSGKQSAGGQGAALEKVAFYVDYDDTQVSYRPSVAAYQANADLSNVKDVDRYYLYKDQKAKLAENNFVVVEGQSAEFFDIYEGNRYGLVPSFITSDSMMHTYHLYFAMLQKKTEKQSLYGAVERMTSRMLEDSRKQYETLKGSEWEEAAKLNVAYFSIASRLLEMKEQVPDYVKDVVEEELEKIMAAKGIAWSLIMDNYEDYSQYKPRGYYDGDAQLERYFRAMMLYGHLNYAQSSETMNRCALLLTLALKEDEAGKKEWGDIYDVTAFFVGQSDDLTFYEYLPVIDKAYGEAATVKDLIGNQGAFQKYLDGIYELHAPQINSVVFEESSEKTDRREEAKGFRFMGQRFTLDAAVFTQLTYNQVDEAADASKRMLPDGLDVAAAFGSDLALELLIEKGNDRFPNFLEQMQLVRSKVQKLTDYWSSSLYGGWLYTLLPLLEKKGEGYPSFMTNENWQKKSIEGFLGSWTELKHDTILYAKQMMAEMGGADIDEYDDRGYVEPQPELYARLYALTKTTIEGLEKRGYLGAEEKEGLVRLGEMAKRLRDMSVKELQNETLTDEEYDFIREYGGALEHLWYETVKDEANNRYADAAEFPMAIVADVATDPNGVCLEEAIGGAARIYVIFPIDGELHIGIGGVFNYYQFVQPISDRLTDKEWRIKLGMQMGDDDMYHWESIAGPEWTDSYRNYWKDNEYEWE
ncbi:MAG: DUF3160 domain-containing protein [Lachnospiraceae bacterium]|nr:DUF3160 domain-containing protein [Lachnospiraceae bacterium]